MNKPIPGFPLYIINEKGEVWRKEEEYLNNGTLCKRSAKKLTHTKNSEGYYQVRMRDANNKRKHKYVHVLLAEAFIPKPTDKGKVEVNHIDGDKGNNTLENLEWVTHGENVSHAIETGLFTPHLLPNMTKEKEIHICKNCGSNHYNKTFCSKKCENEYKSRGIPSKEELIDMMKYFKSFIVVAPYYGVNESIIRKWCRRYGLPDKVDGWK